MNFSCVCILQKSLALLLCACFVSPAFSQSTFQESQYIEGKRLVSVYNQPNGGPYWTDWMVDVEARPNTKRLIYVEANGKLAWTGTLFFDCDTSLSGGLVSIKMSADFGLPKIYDPELILTELEIEKWKSSGEDPEEIVQGERAGILPYLPPYEVYVISRFLACRLPSGSTE